MNKYSRKRTQLFLYPMMYNRVTNEPSICILFDHISVLFNITSVLYGAPVAKVTKPSKTIRTENIELTLI